MREGCAPIRERTRGFSTTIALRWVKQARRSLVGKSSSRCFTCARQPPPSSHSGLGEHTDRLYRPLTPDGGACANARPLSYLPPSLATATSFAGMRIMSTDCWFTRPVRPNEWLSGCQRGHCGQAALCDDLVRATSSPQRAVRRGSARAPARRYPRNAATKREKPRNSGPLAWAILGSKHSPGLT